MYTHYGHVGIISTEKVYDSLVHNMNVLAPSTNCLISVQETCNVRITTYIRAMFANITITPPVEIYVSCWLYPLAIVETSCSH